MRVDRVHAYAIDPDSVGEGLIVLGPELGQLGPSTTREIKHIEKEDEGAVLRQRFSERDLLTARDRKFEVRGFVPYLQHPKSLLELENVPAVAGGAGDLVTG